MKGQKGFAHVAPASFHFSGFDWIRAAVMRLERWAELGRQRRQLASLSDGALHDLGLSRADISMESERPFWDDPMQK